MNNIDYMLMKRIFTLLIAMVGALSALMAANTQLYLVGGFSNWNHLPENELTTTDGDYYVATYPSGSEIELSGNFKLSDPTWNVYNYGGNLQVEAGKSYTLVKGGGNLNAVGKIKISKIEFTVSTAKLKITGATSANLFDLSKDQGVSLAEYSPANGEKFVSKLTFEGNGIYTGTYTVPGYEFYLKIGGNGNFNTIDFGWNGNYIVLSQPYLLTKGESKFAAVYPEEGDWKAGDVFDVRVTFTSDWTATLLLTKSTVAPDPEPEPGPGDEPTPDPTPDPEPTPEPEPEPDPSPYAEYPLIGYFYWVNTGIEYEPDLEWVKVDNSYEPNLEEIESYQPVWNSSIDVDLVPEKLEQKIYGLDIYKFEVRDKDKIPYVRDGFSKSFSFEDVDITKTPYYANGVWYESIEEMMTWYVRYIPYWDDEASEVMIEESPGVFVATLSPKEETDEDDYYYYCLGNVEDPIIVVGIGEYSWNIQNNIQIPQGFKVMAYLEDANWNTYYKLVPPGDAWDKDYVDLGLPSGLCWAVKNLGADKPEDEGLHFAWGEVEPKEDYSYKTYRWANLLKNNEYIKYVTDDYYGLIDFRTTLEPNDDAANVALGSKWHIPSKLATQELLRECTTEFGYYYGVKGYFITGPNGNAIFLPGAVERKGTEHGERGNGGSYWTSTLYDDTNSKANKLVFSLTYIDSDDNDYQSRTDGLVIRPVIHRDYVAIDEVEAEAIKAYASEHTIYCEEAFQIYTTTGVDVTHLNGALEGIYIVKTEKGNRLISVW